MDAATKETYEKVRVGSDFGRVVENISRFVALKRRKGTFFPVLDFHFIISRLNVHEIIPYINLIGEIAPGSRIQFTRLLHSYPEVEGQFTEIPQETVDEAQRRGAERGVRMFWNLNVNPAKPPMFRCVTWYMPFIFVTGEVIPCCSGNEANRRGFQKATSLGNIFERPFEEIWWGEKYRELRRDIREGRVPEACNDCCLYDRGAACAT
jgi:MoaA/NifB/PqqE/SkfB family radical SAM enzyme